MSRPVFFRQRVSPVSTLSLILADGPAGTASVSNAPDLVAANVETFLATAGGTLDVVTSPPPARGAGSLRSLNGGGNTEQNIASQFTPSIDVTTAPWTFEVWGRINEWPVVYPTGVIAFGGTHRTLDPSRHGGWKIGVCNGSLGTGVTVQLAVNNAWGADPGDGWSVAPLEDPSVLPASKGAARYYAHTIALDTWYHFCMMYNGTQLFTFVNGAFKGSFTPVITTPILPSLTGTDAMLMGSTIDYVSGSTTLAVLTDQARMSRGLRYATSGFAVPAGVFSVD